MGKIILTVLDIMADVFTILGINIFNIKFKFFIIFSVGIVIFDKYYIDKKIEKELKKIRKNKERKARQLLDKVPKSDNSDFKCDQLAKALYLYVKKDKPNIYAKYKKKFGKGKIIICVACFFMMFNFTSNYENINASAQKLIKTFKEIIYIKEPESGVQSEIESESQSKTELASQSEVEPESQLKTELVSQLEPESVPQSEIESAPLPESVSQSKSDKWIKVKLEYPERYPDIDEYEELKALLFYADTDNLNETIKSDIDIWINSCATNTPLDNAVTSSNKSTKYYANIEERFYTENGAPLSSNLLDEVIEGRHELLELYPNSELAWLLANHMQMYALNYSKQTHDEKSILYFYMQSIKYIQKSLEFEMDIECKINQINYLKARYKDIAECELIESNIRLSAYEIYISIEGILNDSN